MQGTAAKSTFNRKAAFAEAYNDLYPVVLGAAYSKMGNMQDAEDLCQEIFVKFFNKMDEIDNARKWLYGALRLELMNYYRKHRPGMTDVEDVLDDAAMTFVNGFRDVRIIIKDAIGSMENFGGERDRTLFDLIAVNGFSYEEAGSQLGMSFRQVRYRYGLAVVRILEYLSKKGINNLEDLL
jgi:RNA polymerase sigma-70 factor (ECF subfamily)